MHESSVRISNQRQLRTYVAETLSQFESLDPQQYPLAQRVLTQAGKPCGLYFCLQGPRAVRLTAIWETRGNTILFYGANGQRLKRTVLLEPPALDCWPSCAA